MFLVGSTQNLTEVRSGGAQQPLIIYAGDDVGELAIVVFLLYLWVKRLKAGRENDRPYLDFLFLRRLFQIDGVILTHHLADATFPLFEVKAAFIDILDQGNGLGEVDMDRFILRYFLVIFVRVLGGAILHAVSAARAFVFENIPGLFCQGYLEVSYFPFYTVDFSIGEDLDIGMPADLDQFGCEYSYGAVVGGKGLVQLGHMAADARRLFNQVDLKAGVGEIKRGLNAADPSADNHDVSNITVSEILAHPFSNLFVFHLISPHRPNVRLPEAKLEAIRTMPL
jgi:hypothetical protein